MSNVPFDTALVEPDDTSEKAEKYRQGSVVAILGSDFMVCRLAKGVENSSHIMRCPLVIFLVSPVRGEIISNCPELQNCKRCGLLRTFGAVAYMGELVNKRAEDLGWDRLDIRHPQGLGFSKDCFEGCVKNKE